MRLFVVDPLVADSVASAADAQALPDAPSISSMLWVPVPRHVEAAQLDIFLSGAAPSYALRSEIMVLGLHPDTATAIDENPEILDDISRRVEGAPLYTIRHDADGVANIECARGHDVAGVASPSTLEVVRQHDVSTILRRSGTELPATAAIHYQGPNGDHYRAFLRPGFALRSTDELDRLAFWLASAFRGRTHFLVDHWSMMSLAYHLGRYISDPQGGPGLTRVESLRSYDEDRDVLARRIELAFAGAGPNEAGILVSVNSSGRLVRDVLLPALDAAGFSDTVAVALASTPTPREHHLEALCVLGDDYARYEPRHCPACGPRRATVIPIQHDTYLLSLAAYTHAEAITKSDAALSTEVVNRYAGIGAFTVHRTHPDGRHHAYFVDVPPIIATNEFQDRLRKSLSPWARLKFDVLLHPQHPAAEALGRQVADLLDVACVIGVDERRISGLPDDIQTQVLEASRVLLVDDVVITGSRIYGYRNQLTMLRRDHGLPGTVDLYFLVAVSRTRTERALQGITDVTHHSDANPHFVAVERLFLPNWSTDSCPWCIEFRCLNELPEAVQNLPLISKRLLQLRRSTGIIQDLYFPWTGMASLTDNASATRPAWDSQDDKFASRYWELNAGSVFGEVQNADLALSVAAAIQRLRGRRRRGLEWIESRLDDEFRSPVAKILDPDLYLRGRYYEPVLVAAILRACRRHDVWAPSSDATLSEILNAHLREIPSSVELRGELVLAVATGFLPPVAEVEHLRDAHPDVRAAASLLLGLTP